MDSIPHCFKIFGLQRSGTNLMQALLLRNFHVEYLPEKLTGWKHGPLRMPGGLWKGRPARFALCVKNPYAWTVSCYRFFRNSQGWDTTMPPQFQRDPSMSFEEFLLSPSYSFDTPIHRWNQMNRLWLNTLPADRTLTVRQEDQLERQRSILADAERKLGFRRRGEQLEPISQHVDIGAKLHGEMQRDYYLDRRYLLDYSHLLLQRVNDIVDHPLMHQLGYPIEQWALEERPIGPINLCLRPFTSDATEAHQAACDPYHFLQIKNQGDDMRVIVDADAAIGASVLLAKGIWPQARVIAHEKCPVKSKLLKSNTRLLSDVTVVATCSTEADIPDSPESIDERLDSASKRPGRAEDHRDPLSGLEVAPGDVERVDLLKIGDPEMLLEMLRHPNGWIHRVRWICAMFPPGTESHSVLEGLAQTYTVESWNTPSGLYVLARRTSR